MGFEMENEVGKAVAKPEKFVANHQRFGPLHFKDHSMRNRQ